MQLSHLIHIMRTMRQQDRVEFANLSDEPDLERWAANYFLLPGLNWTVINKSGEPVACVGFRDVCAGVCVAWFVANDSFKTYMKSMTQAFRVMWKSGLYRRIEAYVNPLNPPAARYVEWLGFKMEGRCIKRARDGSDLLQYAYTG
jgi:RimJ/RimL family protein N-acetyltransferase